MIKELGLIILGMIVMWISSKVYIHFHEEEFELFKKKYSK